LSESKKPAFDGNYIRKLGFLHIKQGSEEEWNKEIKKNTIKGILFVIFILIYSIILPITIFNRSDISQIIFICFNILFLFYTLFIIKSSKKSLNKLFEIPEQKKTKKSKT